MYVELIGESHTKITCTFHEIEDTLRLHQCTLFCETFWQVNSQCDIPNCNLAETMHAKRPSQSKWLMNLKTWTELHKWQLFRDKNIIWIPFHSSEISVSRRRWEDKWDNFSICWPHSCKRHGSSAAVLIIFCGVQFPPLTNSHNLM